MTSGNSKRLLEALSDMLLVPETKAKMVRQVGSRLRLLVGEKECLLLDLRQPEASSEASALVRGDSKTEVDAVIRLSDSDFALVCAGELDPGRAFMTRRLTVRGNLIHAIKFAQIFELLRPYTRPRPMPPPPPRPSPECAQGFVVQRAPMDVRTRRATALGPSMCVPKEVAAVMLVVGAGFLLTQGVPPVKAEGILSMDSSPSTGIMREVGGSTQQVGDLELAKFLQTRAPASSSDCLAQAILDV
eukprot:g6330.t1